MESVTSGLGLGMVMMDPRLSNAFLAKMELLLTLMVVIFAMLCILFALLLVMLCHLCKRRSRGKLMDWGRNHLRGEVCCQQGAAATNRVFTLASSKEERQEEPVYQEIKEVRAAKQKAMEEPSWAPKPTIVYGVITAKERAKYIPPIGLVRPEPT